MTNHNNHILPPFKINKFTKTVASDGRVVYPIDYFNNKITTETNLSRHKQYNKIQADRVIEYDKHLNVNYIRRGVFYVKNYKYSAFSIK
jgi:hypothetical protein